MSDGPPARPTTRRRRPHSSHDKTATAGREKWAFDPESVGQARAARTRRADVARWATDALPAAVEREACGVVFREANGSACVVFAFESGANVVVDLPETTRGAVYRAVLKHADALLAARAGAPPPPRGRPRRPTRRPMASSASGAAARRI